MKYRYLATAAAVATLLSAAIATPAMADSHGDFYKEHDKEVAKNVAHDRVKATIDAEIYSSNGQRFIKASVDTKNVPAGTQVQLQILTPSQKDYYDGPVAVLDRSGHANFKKFSETTAVSQEGGLYKVRAVVGIYPPVTTDAVSLKVKTEKVREQIGAPVLSVAKTPNTKTTPAARYLNTQAPTTVHSGAVYKLEYSTGTKWVTAYSTTLTKSGNVVFDKNDPSVKLPDTQTTYSVRITTIGSEHHRQITSPVGHITVDANAVPSSNYVTTLDPATVFTAEDGNRFVQVTGITSGYGPGAYNSAWVSDAAGNKIDPNLSTVWLNQDGSFAHGQYWFPVPTTNGGTFTVHSETGGDSTYSSDEVTINVPAWAAPTQKLDQVTIYTAPDGNRYFQVSGNTTSYPTGAYDSAWVVTDADGNRINPTESSVYLQSDGSFAHGKFWFPVPTNDGGNFTITSTISTLAMKTTASESVVVPAVAAPTQKLNPVTIYTAPDGSRFFQISGRTSGYPTGTYDAAWLTDEAGQTLSPSLSTVYLESDGSFVHGQYWFPVPKTGGTFTAHSAVGTAAMATVDEIDIVVPAV